MSDKQKLFRDTATAVYAALVGSQRGKKPSRELAIEAQDLAAVFVEAWNVPPKATPLQAATDAQDTNPTPEERAVYSAGGHVFEIKPTPEEQLEEMRRVMAGEEPSDHLGMGLESPGFPCSECGEVIQSSAVINETICFGCAMAREGVEPQPATLVGEVPVRDLTERERLEQWEKIPRATPKRKPGWPKGKKRGPRKPKEST